MKQSFENFSRILNRSKEYEFESHTILVIRDYYTGDEVRLDLSKLTEEMFNEIKRGEPKHEIWERCRANIDSWEERTGAALETIDHMRCGLENADNRLFYDIERQIEDYCFDEDIDQDDLGIVPDDILWYVDE